MGTPPEEAVSGTVCPVGSLQGPPVAFFVALVRCGHALPVGSLEGFPVAIWPRGMILALSARGREFNSVLTPFFFPAVFYAVLIHAYLSYAIH